MGNSLRDQLLNSGLATKEQAAKADADKRKQRKQTQKSKGKGKQQASTQEAEVARQMAAMFKAEKAERDRELNRKREEERRAKELAARVRDLIDSNQVKREPGELAFNFTHGNKIKRLYVSAGQHKQLSNGKLAIASFKGSYCLIPAATAAKLQELGAKALIHLSPPPGDEDDPYADHPIPDDLMW